ncbi:MAG: hypothetical protein ABFQ95_01150 [Pseudomonadota bacterium]
MSVTTNAAGIQDEGLQVFDPSTGQFTAIDLTTKGDLLAYNGSSYVRVSVGADGKVLEADSAETEGLKWATKSGAADISDLANISSLYDTFSGDVTDQTTQAALGNLGWSYQGDLSIVSFAEAGHENVFKLESLSFTAQNVLFLKPETQFLGSAKISQSWLIKIPTLSDGTNSFEVDFGFSDIKTRTGAAPTDGVYWRYTHSENSGDWTVRATKSSTTTTANTSNTVDTGWHVFKIEINSAVSSASFFYDGTEVANSPITTNLPLSTTGIHPYIRFEKTAGATTAELLIDTFYQVYDRT